MVLYRPVGAEELRLIEESGFTAFPPRLPAEELEAFNRHMVGRIEVITHFPAEQGV